MKEGTRDRAFVTQHSNLVFYFNNIPFNSKEFLEENPLIDRISFFYWKKEIHSKFVYFIDVRILKAKREQQMQNGQKRIADNVKKTSASGSQFNFSVLPPENIIGIA